MVYILFMCYLQYVMSALLFATLMSTYKMAYLFALTMVIANLLFLFELTKFDYYYWFNDRYEGDFVAGMS
jgi:hypothetical protein